MDDNFETRFKNFENKLSKFLPTIAVIIIGVWWVFYGMVEIMPTGLSLTDRIAVTVCNSLLAVCYSSLIGDGGYQSAKDTTKYTMSRTRWYEATTKVLGEKKAVDRFAEEIAINNLKKARTNTLSSVGLKYEEVFDETGKLLIPNYKHNKFHKKKNVNGLFKEQIRAIKHCLRLHIIVPEVLSASNDATLFGLKAQASEDTRKKVKFSTSTIVKIIASSFATGIMIAFLGVSASAIIYALLQIALWTATGVYERMGNYNFILNKIVPQIIDNTLIIEGYINLPLEEKAKYKGEDVYGKEITKGTTSEGR